MSVNCGVLHCYTNTFGLCDDIKRKCPIKAGQGSLLFDNPIGNYKHVSNLWSHCNLKVIETFERETLICLLFSFE